MLNETVKWIYDNKIVAIAREIETKDIVYVAEALYRGGIRSLEITFNQASETCIQDTADSIALVRRALGGKMKIGAGTVMSIQQAEAAAAAGADFALAPNTNPQVIRKMCDLNMAAVPGAFTPSEVAAAYEAGASIVKLFPVGNIGLDYVKAVRGPLNHIPLMAVGGVDLDNIKDFLDSGFTSVGISSNIVKKSLVEAGRYDEIEVLAKKYVEKISN